MADMENYCRAEWALAWCDAGPGQRQEAGTFIAAYYSGNALQRLHMRCDDIEPYPEGGLS